MLDYLATRIHLFLGVVILEERDGVALYMVEITHWFEVVEPDALGKLSPPQLDPARGLWGVVTAKPPWVVNCLCCVLS